jgi:MFS transporter, LPLT family, lysophospholipid transporter
MKLSLPFRHAPIQALLSSQFLSAFADNMVLFVINKLLASNGFSAASLALVSMAFFVPYILLAPFVGPFADKYPKSVVLLIGNAIKVLGVVLLIFGNHSSILFLMLCYFTVGLGAVVYSPAKYGILPELTHSSDELYQANAKIEGYTIAAIILGIGGGGSIASMTPVIVSTLICMLLYSASMFLTLSIPRIRGADRVRFGAESRQFFRNVGVLLRDPRSNFSLFGTGTFWMSTAVLRVAVIAWIPFALGFDADSFQVSLILASTSIGIIAGALLSPKLVPLRAFIKSLRYGALMLLLIFIFPWIHVTAVTVILLLVIGFFGGVYMVPLNVILQESGLKLVGAGKTIAVQNFFENGLMLLGSVIFYLVLNVGVTISGAFIVQGCIFLCFLMYLAASRKKHLPAV